MMLAGNANSRSSTHTDAPTSVGSSRPFSAPMSGPQPSPASPAPPTTQTTTTAGVTVPSAALPPPELLPVLIASTLRQPTVRNVQIGKLSSHILILQCLQGHMGLSRYVF